MCVCACVFIQNCPQEPLINYENKQGGGGGVAKCLWYYIILCCKLVYEGEGGGVKNPQTLVYVVYERSLIN